MRRLLSFFFFALLSVFPLVAQKGQTFYVKEGAMGDGTSWASAIGDLQGAIDMAQTGAEIWIAKGTYKAKRLIKSSKKRSFAFILKEGVSLYGGFEGIETKKEERKRMDRAGNCFAINETILSADDDIPDIWTREKSAGSDVREEWKVVGNEKNANHILYSKEIFKKKTVIEGFTLKGANSDVWNVYPGGGALFAGGNITLSDCTITEHSAYTGAESTSAWKFFGGAVAIVKGNREALIKNCAFSKCMVSMPNGTAAGAGVYIEEGTIENTSFEECIALDQGGAIFAKGSTIRNCLLNDSYAGSGGGIYALKSKIEGNKITGCTSIRGGAIFAQESTLQNNILFNCFADDPIYTDPTMAHRGGGGIWAEGKSDIVGNLIYNCSAFKGGGVVMTGEGNFVYNTISHCKASFEPDKNSFVVLSPKVSSLNSISQEVDVKATFVRPSSFKGYSKEASHVLLLQDADWHLLQTSPLVGTASTSDYDNTKDIYGDLRIQEGKKNPGAIAKAVKAIDDANISLRFASLDKEVSVGTGGYPGTSFDMDYGDGVKHHYEGAKTIKFKPLGVVKIYGDEIAILKVYEQALQEVSFGTNPKLANLQLGKNKLTKIDLRNLSALKGLYLEHNYITGELDLSAQTAINVLSISDNQISGTLDLSRFSNLTKVACYANQIEKLLLPTSDKLTEVECSMNNLTELDVTTLPELRDLDVEQNRLTSLNTSLNTKLEKLYCPENQIGSLDISKNKELKTLTAYDNLLQTIDLSQNSKLEGLYLQKNQLKVLDLKNNTALKWINVGQNALSALSLRELTDLTLLNASYNKLTTLDLANNPLLNTLHIGNNSFTTIDLSKQKNLYWLTCENNKIALLDLKANRFVSWLECGHNLLRSLDLSAQTNLQKLFAEHNLLSSIDLKGKEKLQGIKLNENKLDATMLNKLVEDIPDVSKVQIHKNNKEWAKLLDISNNPGTKKTDVTLAKGKGWIVKNETALSPVELSQISKVYFSIISKTLCFSQIPSKVRIYDLLGNVLLQEENLSDYLSLASFPLGEYIAQIYWNDDTTETIRFCCH